MKKFDGVMLSAIIITLIFSSTQTIIADDNPNVKTHTLDPDINLRYEVYLQTTVRDAQGQLLSVSESIIGWVTITTFPDGKSQHYNRWLSNPRVIDGSVITVGREEESEPIDVTKFFLINFVFVLDFDHGENLYIKRTINKERAFLWLC